MKTRTLACLLLAVTGCSTIPGLGARPHREDPLAISGSGGRRLLRIGEAPAKGNASAPLVIVEFVDFECPVSARHLTEIMPDLEERYVQTGNVRYVALDFPLPSHRRAMPAAVAARCAGRQGKFWEMHDRLLSNQRALDDSSFPVHASALDLDVRAFRECLESPENVASIEKAVAAGTASGVRSTPTFLIGVPVADETGTIEIAEIIPGVSSSRHFAMILDRVLRTREAGGP